MIRFAKSVYQRLGQVGAAGLRMFSRKHRGSDVSGQSDQGEGWKPVLSLRRLFLSTWTLVGTASLIWLAVYMNYMR